MGKSGNIQVEERDLSRCSYRKSVRVQKGPSFWLSGLGGNEGVGVSEIDDGVGR